MSVTPEARVWLDSLGQDPAIHLHAFDVAAGTATLVRLGEAAVRDANFLDDRALSPVTRRVVVPLEAALEAANALPTRRLDLLCHVSHCGSTLVSRLIGELPGNLPKREPLWWRDVGLSRRETGPEVTPRAWDALWSAGRRALARTWRSTDRVLLKSPTIATNLLSPLLVEEPESRALLLTTDVETWLANTLRDADDRAAALQHLRGWARDARALTRDDSLREDRLAPAEQLALCWIAPMLHFEAALRAHPGRVKLLRFEDVLAMPRVALAAASGHLGLGATPAQVSATVASPLLVTYSRSPDQAYDAADRQAEIVRARKEFADDIRVGQELAMVYAADSPLIAAYLKP